MKIHFYKYHGTGNDFIIIDNRHIKLAFSENIIVNMCHRRFGVGADGLILLEDDNKKAVDFSMRYFNADGMEASLCGNGGRCITAFAHELGLIRTTAKFRTSDGIHSAEMMQNGNIRLRMNDVEITSIENEENTFILNTGSPHLVIFLDALDGFDAFIEGKKIRNSKRFVDEGINVNFVAVRENEIHLKTYERGVENITYSCGTGSIATALAFSMMKNNKSDTFRIQNMGGELIVYFQKTDTHFTNICLEGEAVKVFDGTLEV